MNLSQFKSKNWLFLFLGVAIAAIPFTVMQLQSQQELRQRATEITWSTSQSATSSCPTTGSSGAIITVKFNNTETSSSKGMKVIATDQQTGQSVDMGSINAGQSKTDIIETGEQTLNAGSVRFDLKWSNGSSGTDTRSASYKAVTTCNTPTATPTTTSNTPIPTPTTPPGVTPTEAPAATPSPTPTICPTVGPVKNIRIDCPNCP